MWQQRLFEIAHYADQGVLILLIVLSLMSLIIIAERFWVLKGHYKETQHIQVRLQQHSKNIDLSALQDLSENSEGLEAKVLSLALEHLRRGHRKGLSELFNLFVLTEKPALEKRLGFLATVGSNGPYIGLFGTVLGIMKAFHEMSQAAEAGQQTVMAGISAALIATAAGLMVAIPAVLAYNYFQRQVKSIISSLESCKEFTLSLAESLEERNGL